MFTGLVEEIGRIESIIKSEKSARITILANEVLKGGKLGDSISTNGVCLTITAFTSHSFTIDVMAETMRKSNLRFLKPGNEVNLERALKVGDRLGGHLVSGHIDGIGTIKSYEKEDNAVWLSIQIVPQLLRYIIQKGSVAIDGVSLTVAYVDEIQFKVSIIPHTKEVTTLLKKKTGDEVNIECDMVGKYIEKFLQPEKSAASKEGIDIDFLSKHGFV